MSLLHAIVLGIVQGATEFLPVSSSGHLVLANYWLGFGGEEDSLALAVDIATNTGTFLAVLLALRHDVALAFRGFFSGLVHAEARSGEGWRLALMVLLGSVPTALLAFALKPVFEDLNSPLPVALALAVTGIVLWTAPRSGSRETARELRWRDALVAGLAQGLAIVPGISRSGSTIAALLWRGTSAALAARLSFLLYLVASSGVALLGRGDVREAALGWGPLVAMTVASFVTGYVALTWLFALLRAGRFRLFAPYLWTVSALTLARLALTS